MPNEIDKIKELEEKLKMYEEDGIAKLYYSLQRKAWEMADLMNATNLKSLDISDSKDKTFDRLKVIWQDASSIASAVKSLGEAAGLTGDESADVKRKNFRITPESMADSVGELAGRKQ